MTTRIMVVMKVFIWLESQHYTHVGILSDSLSMIRKIGKSTVRRQWFEFLERSRTCKVTFFFTPEKKGVQGNERADRSADWTVIKKEQPIDCAVIMNNLRKIDRKEDIENREWTPLLRIKVMGIKMSHSMGEKENMSTNIEWELLVFRC